MKKIISLLVILHMCSALRAQDTSDLPALGIIPFYSHSRDSLDLSKELYEAVARRLVQSGQFRVIDIPKRESATKELETMKQREFIRSEIIRAGESTPAEFLLVGFIRNSEIFPVSTSRVEVRIDYEVKFIDVSSGEALEAQSFTGNSWTRLEVGQEIVKRMIGLGKKNNTNEKADGIADMLEASYNGKIIDAIDHSADKLYQWALNTSRGSFYYLKIADEGDPKNIQNILIEGGRDAGLRKNMRLLMVMDEEITGPRGNTVIDERTLATLKVTDVRAETAVCRIMTQETDLMPYLDGRKLRVIFDLDRDE